jgi:hypothetical protein
MNAAFFSFPSFSYGCCFSLSRFFSSFETRTLLCARAGWVARVLCVSQHVTMLQYVTR